MNSHLGSKVPNLRPTVWPRDEGQNLPELSRGETQSGGHITWASSWGSEPAPSRYVVRTTAWSGSRRPSNGEPSPDPSLEMATVAGAPPRDVSISK